MILNALKYGNELKNSEAWKNRAAATQSVASILGAGVAVSALFGAQIDLPAETIATISGAVVAVGGAFSALIGLATSRRVGLGKAE